MALRDSSLKFVRDWNNLAECVDFGVTISADAGTMQGQALLFCYWFLMFSHNSRSLPRPFLIRHNNSNEYM